MEMENKIDMDMNDYMPNFYFGPSAESLETENPAPVSNTKSNVKDIKNNNPINEEESLLGIIKGKDEKKDFDYEDLFLEDKPILPQQIQSQDIQQDIERLRKNIERDLKKLKEFERQSTNMPKNNNLSPKNSKIIMKKSTEPVYLTDVLLWSERQLRLAPDNRSKIIHGKYAELLLRAKQCHNDLTRIHDDTEGFSINNFPPVPNKGRIPGTGYNRRRKGLDFNTVLKFLKSSNAIKVGAAAIILLFGYRMLS